jgi:hypothetical protein
MAKEKLIDVMLTLSEAEALLLVLKPFVTGFGFDQDLKFKQRIDEEVVATKRGVEKIKMAITKAESPME